MLANLTIRTRLILLAALSIVGLAISSAIGLYTLAAASSTEVRTLTEVRDGARMVQAIQGINVAFKTQVQEWKNILLRGSERADFEKYRQAFKESEKQVQEGLQRVTEAMRKERHPSLPAAEHALRLHQELGLAYEHALAAWDVKDQENYKKGDQAMRGKDRAVTQAINQIAADMANEEARQLDGQIVEAQAQYQRVRNQQMALITLILLAVLAALWAAISSITRPIQEVRTGLNRIRTTLDLTCRVPTRGRNEISAMASDVNAMIEEFRAIIGKLGSSSDQVSGASEALSQSMTQLTASVEQQTEAASSMAASVQELAVSVAHVSDSSASAKRISNASRQFADQGGDVIAQTVDAMMRMAETVEGTAATIDDLQKRSQEIDGMAGIIKEIADQTNLLALNAAIEAARAGDQGRGFAVVADEVRKLAERTTRATTEIAQVIGTIQATTKKAVEDMRAVVSQANASAESARSAGDAMVRIRQGSGEVVEVTTDMSTALIEQTSASELIAKQVERVASMSDENAAALGQIAEATDGIRNLSKELREVASRFRA